MGFTLLCHPPDPFIFNVSESASRNQATPLPTRVPLGWCERAWEQDNILSFVVRLNPVLFDPALFDLTFSIQSLGSCSSSRILTSSFFIGLPSHFRFFWLESVESVHLSGVCSALSWPMFSHIVRFRIGLSLPGLSQPSQDSISRLGH